MRRFLTDEVTDEEFQSEVSRIKTILEFAVIKSMAFSDISIWRRKRKALESGGSSDAGLGGVNQSINLIESHLDAFIRRSNMVIKINYINYHHLKFYFILKFEKYR